MLSWLSSIIFDLTH